MKRIRFFEPHDFYKWKDYLLFFVFLIAVTERFDSLTMTVAVNASYTFIYFLTIWLIDHKTVVVNERMISKRGRRLPMRLIERIVHNGRYLYLTFNKNQYMKIYDPDRKLMHLLLLHQHSLKLNKETLRFIERRA